MPYTTPELVAAECRGLPLGVGGVFDATTFVTRDDVLAWIAEAETEVNQVLASVGGSPPYTTAESMTILGMVVRCYAVGKVYQVHGMANGEYGEDSIGGKKLAEFYKTMRHISMNASLWLDKLGQDSKPARFLGHVQDGKQGQQDELEFEFNIGIAKTGF